MQEYEIKIMGYFDEKQIYITEQVGYKSFQHIEYYN